MVSGWIFFAHEEQAAVCGDRGREQTEFQTAEPNTEVSRSASAAGDAAGFVLQPLWAALRNSSCRLVKKGRGHFLTTLFCCLWLPR
ncbi:hypothetical protein NDU88_004704 [Pleurodeles waltl]|uniref:Uncharacterized protein n=1 Tax=Pleurodeles waltl TaxID=8319 RepID=A0AAV7PFY7_PLEWA|nr:hypothetical protein NDU88_004704 [Pleurodeles waltl]